MTSDLFCENGGNQIRTVIRKCVKLSLLETLYAGLIVCFVPLVLGNTDYEKQLTYDSIFNSTKYVQIQNIRRPLQSNNYTYISINPINKYFVNNKQVNRNRERHNDEVYKGKEKSKNKAKLLIGFSHDPYKISIPEADYAKGIRNIQSSDMKGDVRDKRGVSHLYNMISCATGCDPLIFKGYGCYCGFLGSGQYADGIDRCCKMHDECYESIYCPFYTVYFQPYYWKCWHNEPLCALENYETSNNFINGCAARLCECDRLLAMCLRRYRCPRRRALCRSSPLRLLQNILMP